MSARREKRLRRLERRIDALEALASRRVFVMDADYTPVHTERKGLFQRLADIFRKDR